MKRITLSILAVAILLVPYVASACATINVWTPSSILSGPLLSCSGAGSTAGFDKSTNCQDLCDLVCTTTRVVYFCIALVIWIILPIMVVAGGIMYMMGGANPGMLETAKKTLWGAVMGAIIVLCAYILIATFIKFLSIQNIGGFGSPTCTISPPPPST